MTNSLDLRQNNSQNVQQLQRLIMSPAMQQAVHLMQLPALELAEFVETSLEQNPVMERVEETEDFEEYEEEPERPAEKELLFDENDFSVMKQLEEDFRDLYEEENREKSPYTSNEERLKSFLEQSICSHVSLFEYLMEQAHSLFEEADELKAAEIIIGNLDETGYLQIPLEEMAALHHISKKIFEKVLKSIQIFEPYGVGAKNLQECLLIQLRCWNKENSLAYKMIEQHFDDLLHNRMPAIQKGLGCSMEQITIAIKRDLARLDFHPGGNFRSQGDETIVPDVFIHADGDNFRVEVNSSFVPSVRINGKYLRMMNQKEVKTEEKQFIHRHVASAKWLLKNIHQRNETLERIVKAIFEKQAHYFSAWEGQLMPMTMSMLAEELNLHESTVARAVANKYVQTPKGLLPLRFFFSNAYKTREGKDISSKTVREAIHDLIRNEDKRKPMSDAVLAKLLQERGIPCARRTVAKYRTELQLGTAQQRKQFK